MSFPHELTFGVFDAASQETVVPNPVLWVWQVHAKDGKLFASLIDGGSLLNSLTSEIRFLFRSMAPRNYVVDNEASIQRGDVIQLLDYTWRRVAGKAEIIFVIFKLHVLSKNYVTNIEHILRKNLEPYPHENASQRLSTVKNPSMPASRLNVSESTHSSKTQTSPIRYQSLYPSLDLQSNEGSATEDPRVLMVNMQEKRNGLQNDQTDSGAATTLRDSRATPYPIQYKQCGPISRRLDGPFIEIKNLTSFLGRWAVKGRFINKGEQRTYSNSRGEGKLWTCDLIDSSEENGTISCTFFNKAVDKFFPLIKENEIYLVSRGTVRAANRKFNSGSHPFELQLGEDADIQWISADDPTIPVKHLPTITPINNVVDLPRQTSVSVCGIVLKLSEKNEIITRATEQPRLKRELSIVDDSCTSIDVTFWGNKTHILDAVTLDEPCVILIQGARVDEYNGRKLSSLNQTQVHINPDIPQTKHLKNWYEKNKAPLYTCLTTSSWVNDSRISERLTIAELREQVIKTPEADWEDRGRWFTCLATMISIDRERQFYWSACPKCGKKVMPVLDEVHEIDNRDNSEVYVCPGCGTHVTTPVRKYLLNVVIADTTGSLRCIAMGDRGHLVMGPVTPDTLISLQASEMGSVKYQKFEEFFFQRLRREYIFKLHVKNETYRDETRVRYRIMNVDSLNGLLPSESPQSPNGIVTCRSNMIKEAKRALNTIYSRLPRE